MAKLVGRLNTKQCEHLGPGLHADGDGLYLQVKGNGRSWIFRYYPTPKTSTDIGGGPFPLVGVAEARGWRDDMKRLRAQGIDPREHRLKEARAREAEAARRVTFNTYADTYIAAHRAAWRNAVHREQWQSTIDSYVKPVFEGVAIADIDTALVMKVLAPIWPVKPETASRIRGRIEVILDAAKTEGLREGENPARWAGHLKFLLPSKKKVRRVRHHPALPHAQIPAFMAALRLRPGLSARALELCILTASRSGEIIGMDWREVDLRAGAGYGLWTIPPERMKAGRIHRVPLAARALEILQSFADQRAGPVFPGIGRRAGQPMTEATLSKMLSLVPGDWRDANGDRVTVHGFRSTFRDFAGERTNFPREVAEMALAHAVGDETELAYARADLLDKRRRLMLAWSSYCSDWYARSPTICDGAMTTAAIPAREVSAGGGAAHQRLIDPAGDKKASGEGLPSGPPQADTRTRVASRGITEGRTTAQGAGRQGDLRAPSGGARTGSDDGRAHVKRNTVTRVTTGARQTQARQERRQEAPRETPRSSPARADVRARQVQKRNLDAVRRLSQQGATNADQHF